MKKLFAKAFLGICALGTSTVAFARAGRCRRSYSC